MGLAVNLLAAAILAVSILFYVLVYTVWLKRRTPQNIVIGGAAGAFPALIGWAAATGRVETLPVLLFALVFLWTPPHFWALALFVNTDYAAPACRCCRSSRGRASTRTQVLLYSLPMAAVAMAPWALGLAGALYGAVAGAFSLVFVALAALVGAEPRDRSGGDEARAAAVRLLDPLSLRRVRRARRRSLDARMNQPLRDPQDEIRRRQKSRALVMALILGALVILFYAISIAKMS